MEKAKTNREKYDELKKANPKISRKEAAKILGLTQGRISQFEAKIRDSVSTSKPVAPSPDVKASTETIPDTMTSVLVSEVPPLSEAHEIQSEFAKQSEGGTELGISDSTSDKKGKRKLDMGDIASAIGSIVSVNLAKRGYSEFTPGEIDNIKAKAGNLSSLLPDVDNKVAAGVEFASALVAPIAKRIATEKPIKVRTPVVPEEKQKAEATPAQTSNTSAVISRPTPQPTGLLTMAEKLAAAEKRYLERVQSGV